MRDLSGAADAEARDPIIGGNGMPVANDTDTAANLNAVDNRMPATFQGRVDAFWARLPGILHETLYNEMVCPKPPLLSIISALIPSLRSLGHLCTDPMSSPLSATAALIPSLFSPIHLHFDPKTVPTGGYAEWTDEKFDD